LFILRASIAVSCDVMELTHHHRLEDIRLTLIVPGDTRLEPLTDIFRAINRTPSRAFRGLDFRIRVKFDYSDDDDGAAALSWIPRLAGAVGWLEPGKLRALAVNAYLDDGDVEGQFDKEAERHLGYLRDSGVKLQVIIVAWADRPFL
jgi:hypothetical protein